MFLKAILHSKLGLFPHSFCGYHADMRKCQMCEAVQLRRIVGYSNPSKGKWEPDVVWDDVDSSTVQNIIKGVTSNA